MFTLKIITASGNEVIYAAHNPIFNQASNTITFLGHDKLSNSVTLSEGLTSNGRDVAYLMGESGSTLATWRYLPSLGGGGSRGANCGSSLQPMQC
ncbi:hypothetical protein [Serratia fonticola]|uniref:hypothetical protein n=1 Tax=Serratia fonticola TaxID=47917 RepID=UPI0034C5F421